MYGYRKLLVILLGLGGIIPSVYADYNETDGPPLSAPDVSSIPDAIPIPLPYSATGNPDYYEVNGKRYYVLKTNKNYEAEGFASWYGTKFHGKRTSSGEPYNMYAMTAASPTLPIPSFVLVTNLNNGKSIIVKVNDRGPFHDNRVMDLSYAAAKKLGVYDSGTAWVKIVAIDTGSLVTKSAQLYLQVATFRQPNNANLLALQLRRQVNQAVSISTSTKAEQTLYRVLIGPLQSLEQSNQLKAELVAQGFTDGITVRQS